MIFNQENRNERECNTTGRADNLKHRRRLERVNFGKLTPAQLHRCEAHLQGRKQSNETDRESFHSSRGMEGSIRRDIGRMA
jgi:hypothetical protein